MTDKGSSGLLDGLYEKTGIECLNEDSQHPVTSGLFQPNLDLELRSLDDEQLLIKIPFTTPVKVSHISIKCSPNVVEEGSGPKKVKLFTNDPNLDFSGAEALNPKQSLDFNEAQLTSGEKQPLRYVNFQNTRFLTIFVESNQRDQEVTRIGHLKLWGCPESSLDMSKWKPTKDESEES